MIAITLVFSLISLVGYCIKWSIEEGIRQAVYNADREE